MPSPQPHRWTSLLGIAGTGILVAVLLGTITNAINAYVCPLYFLGLYWQNWPAEFNLRQTAIAQGALEGVGFGLLFSTIYLGGLGIITKARIGYRQGVKWIAWIALGSALAWILGGFLGLGFVCWKPDWYTCISPRALTAWEDQIPEAWVHGSITGIKLGGLGSTILALIVFARTHRRMRPKKLA